MQQRLSRVLTHLEAYRRLLAAEADQLKAVNMLDRRQRRQIMRGLRAVRLSARDLELMLKADGDGVARTRGADLVVE